VAFEGQLRDPLVSKDPRVKQWQLKRQRTLRMRIEKGEDVSQQEVKEYLRLSVVSKVTPEMVNQTIKKGKTFKISTVLEAILVYQLPSEVLGSPEEIADLLKSELDIFSRFDERVRLVSLV